MPATRVRILKPDDWHVHLREKLLLSIVLAFTFIQFRQSRAMPNLTFPLVNGTRLSEYEAELDTARIRRRLDRFAHKVHQTVYLTIDTTERDIHSAFFVGATAGKYYPHAGTTGASSGLSTPKDIKPEVLTAMQELGMVLCLHGEVTKDVQSKVAQREYDFIPYLKWLSETYPYLRIVVEHVSDRRMAEAVLALPDEVAMTITAHHPFITVADADEDVHCQCMPYAKTEEDRDYLAALILRAHELPKVFFGSDTAPHFMPDKAIKKQFGVWTSPVAIVVLWEYFLTELGEDAKEAFEAFMSRNGARFYRQELSDDERGYIELVEEDWVVPDEYQGIVPWKHGETLHWRVAGMEWFDVAAAA